MVRLAGSLGKLKRCRVLVAGDLILDSYTIGKAKRISPEAPVAVVNVIKEENLPGGAGNVLLNLVSLGAEAIILGRTGSDAAGATLRNLLAAEAIDVASIVEQESFPTPVKNRVIADNQQIVRIDNEQTTPLLPHIEKDIIATLPALMKEIDILAISDYAKGFLTPTLLKALIAQAKEYKIPVIVDPKGVDYSKYQGADIVKPNLGETFAAAGVEADTSLEDAAQHLLAVTGISTLMVTRSSQGISLFHADGASHHFPVRVKEVKDVTGAGDTVLAMLTVAIASGLSLSEAVQLCNVAAGIAIEKVGCARVTIAQLAQRLLEFDGANKVFFKEHLFALKTALQDQEYSIIDLPNDSGLTPDIYHTIKTHAQEPDKRLVISLKNPSQLYVDMLSSLREVHSIILDEELK